MKHPVKPKISVVLPVHNNAYFLPECLDSLLTQSYEEIEIIAIDDFSRDDSYRVLKAFRQIDKRLRVYRNVKHYGQAMTLNRAIRRAKGQYVAFMDADDILYKDRLKKQLTFLENNPKVVAVGTQCTFISGQGKRLSKSAYPQDAQHIYNKPLHGISMQFETVMINKYQLPKDLLYFNTKEEALLYSDLFIKMLAYGELTNLSDTLQYHRKHTQAFPSLFKELPSLLKVWTRYIAEQEYKLSVRSLYTTFFKPRLGI